MPLQETAARLCRIRPLPGACRLCYHGLAWGLGRIFRALPQVRAAYLAGSMASQELAPGLSDIDFVLVITDLSWEEEYRLVQRLERILRYTMPPWGQRKVGRHVLIYAKREWMLLADLFLGKRCGKPRTVFDKDAINPAHTMDDSIKGLHHLYKALWRLEGLQNALWQRPDSELERQLRARMEERTLLSIHHAVSEYTWRAERLHGETDRTPETVVAAAPTSMRAETTSGANALPLLLSALDEAVSAYAPPEPDSACLEPAGGDEPGGLPDSESAGTTALVSSATDGRAAWVTRVGSVDFVVVESTACEVAPRIFLRLLEAGGHLPFVLTKPVFESLYLNSPSSPWRFTRLPDGQSLTISGAYTRSRALIDAYALFPKFRATIGNSDRERYTATRAAVKALTMHFAARADAGRGESDQGERRTAQTEPEAQYPQDPLHAYQELHGLATHLVHLLSDCMDSEPGSP